MEQYREKPASGAGQSDQSGRAVYRCLHCGELIVARPISRRGLRCPQCANTRLAAEQIGS